MGTKVAFRKKKKRKLQFFLIALKILRLNLKLILKYFKDISSP